MAASSWSPSALRALVAGAALLPLLQACGSRSDTEDYLFDADGPISLGASSGAGGRPGTGASAGRGGSGGAAAVAGNPPIAGIGTGATAPIAGQGGVGTGGFGATGGSVGSGGVTVAGAAGAPAGDMTCGDQVCDSATQSCCLAGSFQCIPRGATCSGPVLGCTSHADCNGELCCLSLTGDAASASACKPTCNSRGPGRDRQLCDSDADCERPFRYCRETVFGLNLCVFRP